MCPRSRVTSLGKRRFVRSEVRKEKARRALQSIVRNMAFTLSIISHFKRITLTAMEEKGLLKEVWLVVSCSDFGERIVIWL